MVSSVGSFIGLGNPTVIHNLSLEILGYEPPPTLSLSLSRRNGLIGLGTAVGGAFAAALISLGTAGAAYADAIPDGYSDLFGETGTTGYPATAGADNASLDAQLFAQNPGTATAFADSVNTFEAGNAHPIADLINAIDPSSFVQQFDTTAGTLASGAYLVPDNSLGYLATFLDYYLLNPIAADYALAPVIEILAASPPF